jgi:hypothetical protein
MADEKPRENVDQALADKEAALHRLRQARPEDLAVPGVEARLIDAARKAGAGWGEIEEAISTPPRHSP